MPKMKTKSGAKKRFRVRPGGTVKRAQAYKRHICRLPACKPAMKESQKCPESNVA